MTVTNLPPTITDASVQLSWAPDGVTTTGVYYGYTTVAVVKYRFAAAGAQTNNLIAAPPSVHPIGEEITWAAIDLQLMLNYLYVMPYKGTDATITGSLSDLNAKLAMARLIERMYASNEPNLSPLAAQLRTEVAQFIADLEDGKVNWDAPYGDATPQAMKPVYNLAQGATIWPPDPSADYDGSNAPYFGINSRTWYRRGSTM